MAISIIEIAIFIIKLSGVGIYIQAPSRLITWPVKYSFL